MNSMEFGVGLVCVLTLLGLTPWLLSASWKVSKFQAGVILFCASTQLVVSMLAIYYSSFALLAFSIVVIIAYLWAGYIGAERFSEDMRNA